VEERCSEGFEKIDGHCIPISVTTSTHTIESETHHTEPLILHEEQPITTLTPVKISGRCPEGMEHGEHGICQEIKLSENITTTEINIKSTTDVNNDKHKEVNLKDCPEGAKRDKDGVCQEIKLSSTTTPIIESKILPKEDEPCLGGMKHDKDGICKEIKLSESTTTTEDNIVSTTDVNDDKRKEVNLMECPEGAKRDEDGSCQPIQPSSTTKPITDPKILLKEDGSCPDDYKMIEGRCLYVKPKTKSTLPLKTSDDDVSSIQPKVGKDISQYELVPVLADNSCPEGTEQAEFGLCQKRVPTCPIGSEFLDGKCLPKRLPSGPKFTTSTSIPETTPIQRPIDHDELTKSTPETKPIEQPIDHDELIKSTPELETGTITIHEKTEKVITKPVQRLHAQE
jgi:hypothetical protein